MKLETLFEIKFQTMNSLDKRKNDVNEMTNSKFKDEGV